MKTMPNSNFKLIYILPNLFTSASIFFGFTSMIASVNHQYDKALMYIIVALICDALDGRVARATNTSSKFGVEYDSLADVISFGVAPALLFYNSIGLEYGRLGILVSGLYTVFAAIRLARFNVSTSSIEPSVFIGLPTPTAAVVSALWVLFYEHYDFLRGFEIIFVFMQVILGILMVSNIRYPSFKKLDFTKAMKLKVLILLVLLCSFLYLFFLESLLFITSFYVFFGVFRAFNSFLKAVKKNKKYKQEPKN